MISDKYTYRRRSNILLSFILATVLVVLFLVSLSFYVSNNFKLINQEKQQIAYLNQVGRSIDSYWLNKLSVLDQLSINEDIIAYLNDRSIEQNVADMLLNAYKSVSAASIVYLMDKSGLVEASSYVGNSQKTLTGNNYSFRPYFTRAILGETVVYPAVGVTTFERGLYLSKAVVHDKTVLGVVVIKLPLNYIDKLLGETNLPAVLVSPDEVIFAATHKDWLYRSLYDLRNTVIERLRKSKQFADIQPVVLDYDLLSKETEIYDETYNVYNYTLKIDGWKLIVCNLRSEDLFLDSIQKRFIVVFMAFLLLLSIVLIVVSYLLVKNKKSVAKISKSWEASEKKVKASAHELALSNERLEKELEQRAEIEKNLEKKMQELERFNKVAVGREERIIELKKEVNALCRRLSKPDKYKSDYNLQRGTNFETS